MNTVLQEKNLGKFTFKQLGGKLIFYRLSEIAKQCCLQWALEHAHWTVEDWENVIWTDECAVNIGGAAGNLWVTRCAGEEYEANCI